MTSFTRKQSSTPPHSAKTSNTREIRKAWTAWMLGWEGSGGSGREETKGKGGGHNE